MSTDTKQAALRAALLPMLAAGLTGEQRLSLAFTYETAVARHFLLGMSNVTYAQLGRAFEDPAVREAARLMMDCGPLLERPRMAQQVLAGLAIGIAQNGFAAMGRDGIAAFLRGSTDARSCALHDAGAAMMDELAKMGRTADRLQSALDEMSAGMAAACEELSAGLEGELSGLAERVLGGAPSATGHPGSRTVH